MHELEIHQDGTTAFVSAHESAWHHLGIALHRPDGDGMTAEEAMRLAYLAGWNVRKTPLATTVITEDGATTLNVPDQFATVRTHPTTGQPQPLGVVGADYTVVQNEEHAEFLNTLVDESGAHFETAGSLKDGRQVFLTLKLPKTMLIGGVDRLDLYVAAFNSHDGSGAFRIVTTPIRVVCANTQRAAIRNARASYSVRHTSGARGRIAEARRALDITWKHAEEFEAAAERMINEAMTLGELERVVGELWPIPERPSTRTKGNHTRRMETLRSLFVSAQTQADIRGTRWAGYQAITEYLDHHAPTRGTTPEVKRAALAERTITGGTMDAFKTKTFDLLTV
jgi:phage/plasmid-like protein (TIGR03299 family)